MLKREITYEDFNGNKVTDVFYFHISKPELIELEVEYPKGLTSWIEKIIKTNDHKELMKLFKEIVLLTYGEKSEDGKRFIKSDELRTAFSQSPAYSVLFMELASQDEAAVDFLKGVLPKDMAVEFENNLTNVKSVPSP